LAEVHGCREGCRAQLRGPSCLLGLPLWPKTRDCLTHPWAASSPHLTQEGHMGNICGALTFSAWVKQALTTHSAGNGAWRGPPRCQLIQHRACSGRHLGLESPASGRKGEKQPETPSGSFDNLFPKLTHLRGNSQWGLGGPWLGAQPRKPDSRMSIYICGWVTSWSEPRKEKHGERPKRNEPLTGGLLFNQTVLNR